MPGYIRQLPASGLSLRRQFAYSKAVWQGGRVVWGRIIKANSSLFDPGEEDLPGEVLFSLTDPDESAVERLPENVRRLWEIAEETEADPAWSEREKEWWEDMNNDHAYHEGFRLPNSWQPPGHEYMGTSLVFHRKHLPEERITTRFLPLLVCPESPHLVTVVPLDCWPAGLAAWLRENHPPQPGATVDLKFAGSGADRHELREVLYQQHIGPIGSVFHEPILVRMSGQPQIHTYFFDWKAANEVIYLTGGMSDAYQPGAGGSFNLVELVLYAKKKDARLAEMLKNFAHFPFETGQALGPWHTVPLGHHGQAVFGTPRFTALLFAPMIAKQHHVLMENFHLEGEQVHVLNVIPLTDGELKVKLGKGIHALLAVVEEAQIDLSYDPDRKGL